LINKIHASGEEVKAKNEKRRTRAREEIPEFAHEKERMGALQSLSKKSRLSM